MHKAVILAGMALIGTYSSLSLAKAEAFPITMVMLDTDSEQSIDFGRAQRFVEILNEGFKQKSGRTIFNFELKSLLKIDDVDAPACASLTTLGYQVEKPDRDNVERAFNECDDDRLVDKKAINVFIFRSLWDEGEERKSSRIYFNYFKPFIFMNLDRLDNDWSVWQHEFGHVFGLPEYYVCDFSETTPSNIMAKERSSCSGAGGTRELGFEPWQVAIIKSVAPLISARLYL